VIAGALDGLELSEVVRHVASQCETEKRRLRRIGVGMRIRSVASPLLELRLGMREGEKTPSRKEEQ
jgi:hypothetical protein